MDICLETYQRECIEDIFNKIESGAKRISVAMTVDLAKKQNAYIFSGRNY